jgi:hypothetical protein
MSDNRINYNDCVGVDSEGDYIFLDNTFEHSEDFRGAVGTTLSLVGKENYEYTKTIEGMLDYGWKERWETAVADDQTEEGLTSWLQDILSMASDDDFFDTSNWSEGQALIETLVRAGLIEEDDYPITECSGGGRMFRNNTKFDIVYRPDLIEVINKAEGIVIDISNAEIVDLDQLIKDREDV